MIWTKEQTAELRRLAKAGQSGSEIAKILGVTRNAITGKADREGIRLQCSRERHAARCSEGARVGWARDDGSRREAAAERMRRRFQSAEATR